MAVLEGRFERAVTPVNLARNERVTDRMQRYPVPVDRKTRYKKLQNMFAQVAAKAVDDPTTYKLAMTAMEHLVSSGV
jgi:hypothetical protein